MWSKGRLHGLKEGIFFFVPLPLPARLSCRRGLHRLMLRSVNRVQPSQKKTIPAAAVRVILRACSLKRQPPVHIPPCLPPSPPPSPPNRRRSPTRLSAAWGRCFLAAAARGGACSVGLVLWLVLFGSSPFGALWWKKIMFLLLLLCACSVSVQSC